MKSGSSEKSEEAVVPDSLFAFLGWRTGVEPATFGTTIRRSNQLSYIHHVILRCKDMFFSFSPKG